MITNLSLCFFESLELEEITLVPHLAKCLVEVQFEVTVNNSCKGPTHSLVALKGLLKTCERVFHQCSDFFLVVSLGPVLDFFFVDLLLLVDLKQEKEYHLQLPAHHLINTLQRLLDSPALMAVSQELVKILMLNLFFPTNESLQNSHKFGFLELMGFLV